MISPSTSKHVVSFPEKQVELARSYCLAVARNYWRLFRVKTGVSWSVRRYSGEEIDLPPDIAKEARDEAHRLSKMAPEDAGYQLSIQYMNLLPSSYRSQHGVYYTPIQIAERMIADATDRGIDFQTAKVIDPASGGSAFLAPLCRVMRKEGLSDQAIVDDLCARLTGFEMDPFAAWLSQFVVDCELAMIAPTARKPTPIVHQCDALRVPDRFFSTYDYVIGNPPYGRIPADDVPTEHYSDIVSGSPNLYQLFYKLAFLLTNDHGVVHLLTPTGFLGGRYFTALRAYLEAHANAVSFDFFVQRTKVFDGVQQELVISLFTKRQHKKMTVLRSIDVAKDGALLLTPIGSVRLTRGGAWVLPRTMEGWKISKVFQGNHPTLSELGYVIHTGSVVPFRSQQQFRKRKTLYSFPVIWSESIRDDGFDPDASRAKGRPRWYSPEDGAGKVTQPAILIKRTSSKEQSRRIHAVLVDQAYLGEVGGFFAENHINVLLGSDEPSVDLDVILRLLKTQIVDQLFRCISGTVTVSATELNQLPIPGTDALQTFAHQTRGEIDVEKIEAAARAAYGVA